jgi:tRNA (guanine37-N1)-methyltransferase
MRLDVVTIFPDYLAPLELSLIGKARRDGLIDLRVHNLRDFTHDRHHTVDDTPYGGGAGMVMKPRPWAEALDHVAGSGEEGERPRLVVPGPGGMPFTQEMARELAKGRWLAFACGRYEGIDERVYEHAAEDLGLEVSVVSLGDYVLNGGEVAVLAMVEAVARLLPGVIGNAASLVEESHEGGLLEYPVYTKPARWQWGDVRRDVPAVLLSGDHTAIAQWRHQQRLERTAARRPDLLHGSAATAVEDLDIAVATAGDAAEILVLQRACFASEAVRNGTTEIPALMEPLEDVLLHVQQWQTWVVRAHGRLVGSVGASPAADDPSIWEIHRLVVAPDLEGRGIGRWLLAHAEAAAPPHTTAHRLETGALSERNLRLYRKAGYRPKARIEGRPTVDLVKRRAGD